VSDATTIDAGQGGPSDDASVGSRAYLVVREGDRTQVIDLDEGAEILIGRSSQATVRIDDAQASREHARIERRGGSLRLTDLGGRNGTRLNDETVRGQARPLRSGDLVRIGAAEILVAESAGVVGPTGSRLSAELERVMTASGGRAALLRLSLSDAELAQVSPLLAGAALIEAQSDGDHACLLEDASRADEVLAELGRRLPAAAVSLARAPQDGRTATELWRRTAEDARSAPVAAPAPGVVVGDPAMARVFELVRKVALAPTTVLILGETGVGKEVVAEQIHRQSPRAKGPFVRLNCGSLPETLLESELFGHEKGAFTGADRRKLGYLEAAAGGTLFLDEVGELALTTQVKLLRVLEARTFMRVGGREEVSCDLRVVAATNRNLEAETKTGRFREDLYFRLSAFVIRVPPLRERPAEIELLAQLFARQLARAMSVGAPSIAPQAMSLLRRHAWPGNVRELRNAIEHAVVLVDDGVLRPEQLPDSLRLAPAEPQGGSMPEQLAEIEARRIREALAAENNNQTRAAKRLGISRRALIYKLEKFGIKS
jgi:DNA-binding NtrC family response regulator/pSer/pThr/pTyr-binding forkhead associated (FHA) protein